ncbi:tachykinin receptor 3 [Rhinolophus ferrumequinum]|uniref:Tachykinin receptor 3 n=1 Tax=Rhinolophus ferrumequinum TaxID=59479 RepID=A0A7J7ZE69_RHIFE|nr:tachykinin receptor 3 [Rhinolophus ferrumequinum]
MAATASPSRRSLRLVLHAGITRDFPGAFAAPGQPHQPVRAAVLAHRALVPSVWRGGGRGSFRESHRHLDHPSPQAHEDRHQLLPREPGFLRRLHGRLQHLGQLHLRASQRVVLRRQLLSLPEFLSYHSGVRQHLLYDGHCCGQVYGHY